MGFINKSHRADNFFIFHSDNQSSCFDVFFYIFGGIVVHASIADTYSKKRKVVNVGVSNSHTITFFLLVFYHNLSGLSSIIFFNFF